MYDLAGFFSSRHLGLFSQRMIHEIRESTSSYKATMDTTCLSYCRSQWTQFPFDFKYCHFRERRWSHPRLLWGSHFRKITRFAVWSQGVVAPDFAFPFRYLFLPWDVLQQRSRLCNFQWLIWIYHRRKCGCYLFRINSWIGTRISICQFSRILLSPICRLVSYQGTLCTLWTQDTLWFNRTCRLHLGQWSRAQLDRSVTSSFSIGTASPGTCWELGQNFGLIYPLKYSNA